MKYSFLILALLFLSHSAFSMDPIEAEQKKEIQRLKERKKAYEIYQKQMAEKEKLRRSKVGQQKTIRAEYEKKAERARKNFDRVEKKFPIKAYRKFQKRRDKRDVRLRSVRKNYVKMQSELEKVHENSRYKINKMQEYEL